MAFCNTEDSEHAFKTLSMSVGLLAGEMECTGEFDRFDPCQLSKLASRIGDLLLSHDLLSRSLNQPLTDWSAWMKPDQNPSRRHRW